jgi:hypothetical protein
MKRCLALLAFTLLTASVALAAPPAAPTPPSAAIPNQAAPERSPETLLADIFAPRPMNRTASCEEEVYEQCMIFCWELSQTNGCDFFASQTCLCWRYPVDCPVCY